MARCKETTVENCFRKLDTKFGWPRSMETFRNHAPKIALVKLCEPMFQNPMVSKLFENSARSKETPLGNCFRNLDTKFGWLTTMGTSSNHVPKISLVKLCKPMFQNPIVSKLFENSARSKETPLGNRFTNLDTKFGCLRHWEHLKIMYLRFRW